MPEQSVGSNHQRARIGGGVCFYGGRRESSTSSNGTRISKMKLQALQRRCKKRAAGIAGSGARSGRRRKQHVCSSAGGKPTVRLQPTRGLRLIAVRFLAGRKDATATAAVSLCSKPSAGRAGMSAQAVPYVVSNTSVANRLQMVKPCMMLVPVGVSPPFLVKTDSS